MKLKKFVSLIMLFLILTFNTNTFCKKITLCNSIKKYTKKIVKISWHTNQIIAGLSALFLGGGFIDQSIQKYKDNESVLQLDLVFASLLFCGGFTCLSNGTTGLDSELHLKYYLKKLYKKIKSFRFTLKRGASSVYN